MDIIQFTWYMVKQSIKYVYSIYLIYGEYMNITLKLEGFPEEVINRMIARGMASNKTEAVRLTVLDYNEHHRVINTTKQELEDYLAVKKMQEIDKEIEQGKRKVLTEKEVFKKYPHLKDV